MATFYSSQFAQKVASSAIKWAGGVDFARETGIEKFWTDSKIVSYPSLPSALSLITSVL